MLRIPGKIPVTISPFFWVTSGLIGFLYSRGEANPFLITLIWMFVIFISILFHEFGHAITARFFGQTPRIELVAFGGLTYPEGKRVKGWREFLVVLNGPVFGFLLFLLATALLSTNIFTGSYVVNGLKIMQWVNLFWTAVNLLPVMPLDGGQLLRVICESVFKAKGVKYALFASMLFAGTLALLGFFVGQFIIGALFFLFAFQNFDSYRRMRVISESDRDDNLAEEMKEIEELLVNGRKEEATAGLEKIRARAKKGLLFNLTTQYLASIKAEAQDHQAVYDLLKPIHKHLSPQSQLLLHRAAYEVKDYPLVAQLSGACFKVTADPGIALRSAEAYATLGEVEPTVGWLKAAQSEGVSNLKATLEGPIFDKVRHSKSFQAFSHDL